MKYFNKIFSHKYYPIIFSLMLAVIMSILFSPGIPHWDSLTQLLMIKNICNGTGALYSHFPLLPTFLIIPLFCITGDAFLVIFIQVFLFSFALFFFVHSFSKSALANFITSVIIMLPINLMFSIFYVHDIKLAIAILALSAVLINKKPLWAVPVLTTLAAGTRLNFIPVIPIVIFMIYKIRHKFPTPRHFYACIAAIVAGIFLVLAIPYIPGVKKSYNYAKGPAWEYTMLISQNPKILESEKDYLRDNGILTTDISNNPVDYDSMDGRITQIMVKKLVIPGPDAFLKHYTLFIRKNFPEFIKLKFDEALKIFGIPHDFPIGPCIYACQKNLSLLPPERKMKEVGYKLSNRKLDILGKAYSQMLMEFPWRLLQRPYIIFIILFALSALLKNRTIIPATLVFAYHCTFIITNHAYDFRYFSPSAYIFLAMLAVSITVSIKHKSTEQDKKIPTHE